MKFSIKDIFSKCDQIRWKLRIWSHLLKKSLMENFIFCAVIMPLFDRQLLLVKNGFTVFQKFLLFSIPLPVILDK